MVTAALLMRGDLRRVSGTMPGLGQYEGGDPAAQGKDSGENSTHHTGTNGPGRRSPAVSARHLAAVP
jgi:hypothetical protein